MIILTRMKDVVRTITLPISLLIALLGAPPEQTQQGALPVAIPEQAQYSTLPGVAPEQALYSPLLQGQYSAADCTAPQTLGADALFGCTNGILFPVSPLPSGTGHTFLVVSRPATAPNDPHFIFTHPGADLFVCIYAEGQLRQYNQGPGKDEVYVATLAGLTGDGLGDNCDHSGGGLAMRGCPTAYGRFFDIDSDGDGEFDDMEVVFIDGLAVPLNFRLLFVPMNWTGTQAQFDTAAQDQVNLFAGSTALGGCFDTIEVITLDVNTQNFNTFACTQDNCSVGSVRDFTRDLGLKAIGYDVVVGMLPAGGSPCWPTVGCSNSTDTVWIQDSASPILAHEIGHIYGLEDEYCSEESGGHSNCAGSHDVNRLGADLGCDPNTGMGCCACRSAAAPAGSAACNAVCDPLAGGDNYFDCCDGNQGAQGGGSRCIMAAAGAGTGAQNWCQRCLDHLNGRTEFACDALPTTPFRNVVAVDLTVSEDGAVRLNAVELGEGRPTRIDRPGDRYRITLDAPGGNLLDEAFDIIHYDVPLPQQEANIHYQAPVDFSVDAPPPLVLTLYDDGEERFRKTLFGSAPVANDDTAVTDEDTQVTIDVAANDTDVDGDLDPGSATVLSAPAHGTLVNNSDGTFDYMPSRDYNGSDSFTYQICDSGMPIKCATGTVNITINPVNDPPVANDDTAVTDEDTQVTIDVAANDTDVDGNLDPGSATALSAPAHGTLVNNSDGTFDYTPSRDYNGSDSFTYQICDTGVPTPSTRTAWRPQSVSMARTGDTPPHTIFLPILGRGSGSTSPTHDTRMPLCATANVDITVNPINDAPVVEPVSPISVDEGATNVIDLDAIVTDVETPDHEIIWVGSSSDDDVANVDIDTATRQATISGIDGWGTATVTLTATDRGDPNGCAGEPPTCSEPLSTSGDLTVTVNNVAPTPGAGADQTVYRYEHVTVSGTWTDPAGHLDDPYTWTWDLDGDSRPDRDGIASYGDTIEETTSFALEGNYTLTFEVTDKDGSTGSDSLVVEVLNRPPDCSDASPSIDTLWPSNHKFVAVDILDVTDPEGDAVEITINSIFQDEPVDSTGDGRHTPDGQGVGTSTAEVRAERDGSGNGRVYHISYTANDGHGGTCSGELLVGVPKSKGKKGDPVDEGPLYDSTESSSFKAVRRRPEPGQASGHRDGHGRQHNEGGH
jgi:hypothetical protein